MTTQQRKTLLQKKSSERKRKRRKERKTNVCYGCKKPGHYKTKCLLEKKESKRKKAYAATWDDFVSSSKEDENKEMANPYFMALKGEEETKVNIIEHSYFSDLSYNKLLEPFHELVHDFTSLTKRLNNMKSMHKNLNKKYPKSSNVISTLKSKNSLLTF